MDRQTDRLQLDTTLNADPLYRTAALTHLLLTTRSHTWLTA